MPTKVNNKWVFTDEELDEQINRAESAYDEYIKDKPVAISYEFDPRTRIISIRANDGSRIDFPVSKIRELQHASATQIRQAYITKSGDAIHWDDLDAHYTVAGLAANIFGTNAWMQELGRKGGEKKSEAKAAAARVNGNKGGRPRKHIQDYVPKRAPGNMFGGSLIINQTILPHNATGDLDIIYANPSPPTNLKHRSFKIGAGPLRKLETCPT